MRILYVIDKMQNYAGIERILSCKTNYISKPTTHNVFLTTYNQQPKDWPFQLNENISYNPIYVPMPLPLRDKMTLYSWLKAYFQARSLFMAKNGDFDDLVTKIEMIICNDSLRRKNGIRAKQNIKRYSLNSVTQQNSVVQ